MKTAEIFKEIFNERTTGRRAMFTVNNLSVEAVKIVLKGIQIKIGTSGVEEDELNGFVKRQNLTGYHGGNDGYVPTAKGYRAILNMLKGE